MNKKSVLNVWAFWLSCNFLVASSDPLAEMPGAALQPTVKKLEPTSPVVAGSQNMDSGRQESKKFDDLSSNALPGFQADRGLSELYGKRRNLPKGQALEMRGPMGPVHHKFGPAKIKGSHHHDPEKVKKILARDFIKKLQAEIQNLRAENQKLNDLISQIESRVLKLEQKDRPVKPDLQAIGS